MRVPPQQLVVIVILSDQTGVWSVSHHLLVPNLNGIGTKNPPGTRYFYIKENHKRQEGQSRADTM